MKITEISKVLGQRWGKMDDAQKKPYQKRADVDKERCVIRRCAIPSHALRITFMHIFRFYAYTAFASEVLHVSGVTL